MNRAIVRGYRRGVLQFMERIDADDADDSAERHAKWLAQEPGTIEIEFLGERDPQLRFRRMSTDAPPRRTVH